MVYSKFNVSSYYWLNNSEGSANTINDALHEAEDQIRTQYPYAVYRDRQDITRFAEQIYQTWQSRLRPEGKSWSRGVGKSYESGYDTCDRDRWDKQQPEQKRLYVSTFVGKYLEELAKKDEAARPKVQPAPKPQPQPTPQPATSPTGATITVMREDHTADTHSYWLRLADPRYLDEAYDAPEPLTFDFSEAPVSDSTMGIASSSYGAYASSSSDPVSLPEYRSKTPQKKKPRIYWGKR